MEVLQRSDLLFSLLVVKFSAPQPPQTLASLRSLPQVPFLVTGAKGHFALQQTEGTLADVAPTALAIMGLPQPKEMTGKSLLA